MFGFLDAGVRLIAQAVADTETRRNPPSILKVKIVSLATHRCFIELASAWRQASRGNDRVGIRRRGQQTRQRVWQWISWLDIVLPTCRRNPQRRVCCPAAERV